MLSFTRLLALFEGTSLVMLVFIAVPLKHGMGIPEVVSVIGPIHGVLFLLFNAVLFAYAARGNLSGVNTILGFFASLIPFGTFVYTAKILNKSAVEKYRSLRSAESLG